MCSLYSIYCLSGYYNTTNHSHFHLPFHITWYQSTRFYSSNFHSSSTTATPGGAISTPGGGHRLVSSTSSSKQQSSSSIPTDPPPGRLSSRSSIIELSPSSIPAGYATAWPSLARIWPDPCRGGGSSSCPDTWATAAARVQRRLPPLLHAIRNAPTTMRPWIAPHLPQAAAAAPSGCRRGSLTILLRFARIRPPSTSPRAPPRR